MDQQVGVLAAKPDNLNSNLRHTHTQSNKNTRKYQKIKAFYLGV